MVCLGAGVEGTALVHGRVYGVELFFDVFERDEEDGELYLQGTGALAR